MGFTWLKLLRLLFWQWRVWAKSLLCLSLLTLIAWCGSCLVLGTSPVLANIDDDRYEGNIFVVFAGNGSLVPPRLSLTQSLQREMATLLVFYLDDSRDCKQFSIVVSRLQEYYGRAANIIPVNVDSLPFKSTFNPEETGYYYQGVVPQTVLLNQQGEIVFNGKGQVKFEAVDDVFREVFDLLPRSESVELKRRSVNEYNTELTN